MRVNSIKGECFSGGEMHQRLLTNEWPLNNNSFPATSSTWRSALVCIYNRRVLYEGSLFGTDFFPQKNYLIRLLVKKDWTKAFFLGAYSYFISVIVKLIWYLSE